MKNTVSLKKDKEFRFLYKKGVSVPGDTVVLYYRANKYMQKTGLRLGITVSKKIGNAVVRNRIRRLIREAYRQIEPSLPFGYDLVIVARKKADGASFAMVFSSLEDALKKGGLLKETSK